MPLSIPPLSHAAHSWVSGVIFNLGRCVKPRAAACPTKMPVNTLTLNALSAVGWVLEILTLSTAAQHEVPTPATLVLGHFNRTKVFGELGPPPAMLKTKVKAW